MSEPCAELSKRKRKKKQQKLVIVDLIGNDLHVIVDLIGNDLQSQIMTYLWFGIRMKHLHV